MITGGDLRQSRLDVGYKTFTISPCAHSAGNGKMPQAKAPELVVKFKPKKINQVIYSD